MTVSVQIPPEVEDTLLRHAAAAGQDVATFVREVVVDRLVADEPVPSRLSEDEFKRRLREVIRMHPPSGGTMDDSRESIYAGRE